MEQKVNILIVDDKEANLFVLEQVLSNPGRNLIRATTGNEALHTVLNKDIDLIILDVQMPGMDGFEVAQILKSNVKTKDIPIIFASAEKTEHAFMMKGFEEGAIDYLYKPLNKEVTEAKVAAQLRMSMQKKQLKEKNFELEKYALLINNSADLICIINPATLKFAEVNTAVLPLLGYTIEETKNTPLTDYLADEYKALFEKLKTDKREKFSFETQLYTKTKAVKWLHWNIINKNNLWFANARDITELKKSVQELEFMNNELESFSYSISHDLRAPLRAINGYSKIIEEEYGGNSDDEFKRLFGVIKSESTRMGRLIDDLLAFSRLGRKEIQKSKVNMNEIVETILKENRKNISPSAKIKVDELETAEGDYNLLYQVYVNLISNAIKYSSKKEEPRIEISAYKNEAEEYIYFVKDNGAGFNMDHDNNLFGVFHRLHHSDEFEGTGVGLAIVRRIILRHGGKVWGEGEVNKGATFYFSLPKS